MSTVAVTGEADGIAAVSAYLASQISGTAVGAATVSNVTTTSKAVTGAAAGVATASATIQNSGGLKYPQDGARVPTLAALVAIFPLAATISIKVDIDTASDFSVSPATYFIDVPPRNAGIVVAKLGTLTLTEGTRYFVRTSESPNGVSYDDLSRSTSFIPDLSMGDGGEEIFWQVNDGSGPPDLWASVPGRAVPGLDLTLFGHGFGDTEGTASITAPSALAMTVVSWDRVAPTANAYNGSRQIDLIKGISDAEHYEVVATVPSNAAGPNGLITVTSA